MASSWLGLGQHGHSHDNGSKCAGHSHGSHGIDIPEELKQQLLKQLEARMKAMEEQGGHGGHSDHAQELGQGDYGDIGHHDLTHDSLDHYHHDHYQAHRSSYNCFLYGYGHEEPSPPHGWDSLTVLKAQPTIDESTWVGEKSTRTAVSVRDNFWLLYLPLLGRLRVVKDMNGMMMSSIVLFYWIYGNWSTWNAILLPHYYDGKMNSIILLLYAFVSAMCIISFFCASTLNPGTLHKTQIPQDGWTECKVCLQMRPPLSHHCRRCGQCVRRMDHHCPWINNCVGEENQYAFLLLLVYSFFLSLFTLILQAVHFFWLSGICILCDHESFVIRYQVPIILISVAMAIFMAFSMAGLLLTQHIGVIHETTTVEWMRLQQQIYMTGIIPDKIPEQTKSCYQTYSLLCGTSSLYIWPFPFRRNFKTPGKACVV